MGSPNGMSAVLKHPVGQVSAILELLHAQSRKEILHRLSRFLTSAAVEREEIVRATSDASDLFRIASPGTQNGFRDHRTASDVRARS